MIYLLKIVVFMRTWSLMMAVSYNKLWKILIDKNMSKTQLIKAAKISTNAMAKLGNLTSVSVLPLMANTDGYRQIGNNALFAFQ